MENSFNQAEYLAKFKGIIILFFIVQPLVLITESFSSSFVHYAATSFFYKNTSSDFSLEIMNLFVLKNRKIRTILT